MRKATTAPYKLTPAHEKQLKPWADGWIKNALRCGPHTENEKTGAVASVNGLYAAAGLALPNQVLFVDGPISASIAAGVAAGVWWLRNSPAITRYGRG